ncbi:MAG: DNA-processing protein DprA [Candidatus Gracilibacteria bacterium]|nr:DNA-processing protein DprA [Candidatus Gracilibacteria bacterium]
MDEKIYLAMLHAMGINHKKLHIIFADNDDYKIFYDSLSVDILKGYDFSDKQIEYILTEKKSVKITDIQSKLLSRNVELVTIKDDKYPESMKQLPNIPFLFYLRGAIDNSPKFSVVGSRKITSYGEKAIESIVSEVSDYFTIVSGGATGCDTKAHDVTMKRGNKTLSVIGTGIDIDYPVSNKKLYDEISISGGGVISIFPVGEVGNAYNFPIRNEIVAGLSVGVLVVEAKNKSGTLITSNLALDLGKDLFAVPGDFFRLNSEGCNDLIKKGFAKLVTNSDDILQEYNISSKNIKIDRKNIFFDDILEEKLYNILILESLSVDELSIKISLDVSTTSFKLSLLEIKKLIKKTYGGKYEVN